MSWRLHDKRFLKGYWPLNSHSRDLSGNGNDGTWVGTEKYADGPYSKSVADLDGSSYINCGEGAGDFDFGSGAFSIEISFKWGTSGINDALFSKKAGGAGGQEGFFLFLAAANTVRFFISDGTNQDALTATISPDDGGNHHVVVSVGSSFVTMYVDGKFEDDAARTAVDIDNNLNLVVGAESDGGSAFTGREYTARVYKDCELTYDEAIVAYRNSKFGI